MNTHIRHKLSGRGRNGGYDQKLLLWWLPWSPFIDTLTDALCSQWSLAFWMSSIFSPTLQYVSGDKGNILDILEPGCQLRSNVL